MRMAGLYNGNSWNEGRGSRKEVAMAKACVTMKALYDIELTARTVGRSRKDGGAPETFARRILTGSTVLYFNFNP